MFPDSGLRVTTIFQVFGDHWCCKMGLHNNKPVWSHTLAESSECSFVIGNGRSYAANGAGIYCWDCGYSLLALSVQCSGYSVGIVRGASLGRI